MTRAQELLETIPSNNISAHLVAAERRRIRRIKDAAKRRSKNIRAMMPNDNRNLWGKQLKKCA